MRRKHKTEKEVQEILRKPVQIQNKFFDDKRKEGIYQFNINLLANNQAPQMRERRPVQKDELRVCTECKGFFSNKYFFKHACKADTQLPQPVKPILLKKVDSRMDSDTEFKEILNRFRVGEVGDFCRENYIVKMIGYRHFCLRKHEIGKQDEVRKTVMAEMRELTKLFLHFKKLTNEEKSVEEMFDRENLSELVDAVQQLVKIDDNKEKHGQKLFLDAIILRSVKALDLHYAETKQDGKKKELKYFRAAYKSYSSNLYPSARQTCIRNSLEKLRKPANLPNEEKLKELKQYITSEIPIINTKFSVKQYAWLRSLVVSRLTLFNARRGEEASRMLLEEWEEAEKGTWLPEDEVEKISDPAEQYLVNKFSLAYLHGKGKKYVPVLVPKDLVPSIRILKENRSEFGIRQENPFLFATKNGLSHCSGWHAVREVCAEAGFDFNVTATKMRHRISSIYTSLDMSVEHRKIFLEHMGHEESVNKQNYQCPQGIRHACIMGRMLSNADEGKLLLLRTDVYCSCISNMSL